MHRRWRTWRNNPNSGVRLAWIAIAGATLSGLLSGGDSPLVNMVGLLLVVATAWFEGRYADAVAEYWPRAVRRGAIVRLVAGFALMLIAFGLPRVIETDGNAWIDAVGAGCVFGGAALILGAGARLLMSDGARYASRKLQERLDDDA